MTIRETIDSIHTNCKYLYQELMDVFDQYVDTDIVVEYWDKENGYTKLNVRLMQLNRAERYFVVKYSKKGNYCYKVIPFNLVDVSSVVITNKDADDDITIPTVLAFELFINFHKIEG